jgi:hypothetical protein
MQRAVEITSTVSSTQGRPLPPIPITEMEGMKRAVKYRLSAEAGNTTIVVK